MPSRLDFLRARWRAARLALGLVVPKWLEEKEEVNNDTNL